MTIKINKYVDISSGPAGSASPTLFLTNNAVSLETSPGAEFARIFTSEDASPVATLENDAGGAFQISGSNALCVGNAGLSFSGTYTLIIRVGAFSWAVSIIVVRVLENLVLSNASFPFGSAPGTIIGTFENVEPGSSLTISPIDARVALASGNTLIVGSAPADEGEFDITVVETNPDASNSPHSTPLTISVLAPVPVNLQFPTISGDLTIGATLTGTLGVWQNMEDGTYAVAWASDGVPIPGETEMTLTYAAPLVGHAITFVVTATNESASVTQPSAAVQIDLVTYLGVGVTKDAAPVTYPLGGYEP